MEDTRLDYEALYARLLALRHEVTALEPLLAPLPADHAARLAVGALGETVERLRHWFTATYAWWTPPSRQLRTRR